MIYVKNGSLSFQDRVLFKKISFSIQQEQKVALIGRNGTGKSTLLKIIAGSGQFDDGIVEKAQNKKIAYMPQEIVMQSDKTVWQEAASIFQDFFDLEAEAKKLEDKLGSSPSNAGALVEYYAVIQEKLVAFDKSRILQSINMILDGLGFSNKQTNGPVEQLSEGWKMRLVLAKLLLQDADFYLFDEPTNHLDIQSKEWFFNFLKNGKFGYLFVSHDRYFLDHACDYILSLEQGDAIWFRGSFSQYCTFKEKEQTAVQVKYEQQQKEIARKKRTIERFRASASKAKMAQSMIKQLEKVELIEPESVMPNISLQFPMPMRAGKIVLSVKSLAQSFGNDTIFSNVSFDIMRGEKVAVVAPNGVGKTTLINTITRFLSPKNGAVDFGYNVSYALFEQDQSKVLSPEKTIFEEVADACSNIKEQTIRTFLGTFLFVGDDAFKKINVLSGGERNRVAMVKVLLQKANFLILDEPTNHLDVYAQEVLLQALQQYEGTILFVCHDLDFLSRLATRIIELTPDGAFSYNGSYDSYLAQKKHIQAQEQDKHNINAQISKKNQQVSSKHLFALKKEANALERKIQKKESVIEKLTVDLQKHAYGNVKYKDLMNSIESNQQELQILMSKWEEVLSMIEIV